MRFMVDAVPPQAFTEWLDKAKSGPDAFDAEAYRKLALPGTRAAADYRLQWPDLFDAIVRGASKPARPRPGPGVTTAPVTD